MKFDILSYVLVKVKVWCLLSHETRWAAHLISILSHMGFEWVISFLFLLLFLFFCGLLFLLQLHQDLLHLIKFLSYLIFRRRLWIKFAACWLFLTTIWIQYFSIWRYNLIKSFLFLLFTKVKWGSKWIAKLYHAASHLHFLWILDFYVFRDINNWLFLIKWKFCLVLWVVW